ncbi:MAG TPA: family 1 glycosylhydrolase [bacterium]|nr:family 1 glycosylhydrolase [bacterium]
MINRIKPWDGFQPWLLEHHKKIKFWFSAHSTFQQSPREFIDIADWGREVAKYLPNSSNAPNFWKNSEAYLDLSQFLGQNMFRFSFEISQLCPKLGEFNDRVMEQYIRILLNIIARGQEPMVCLFHWTLPAFFTTSNKESAWDHPEILSHFFFYINKVADYLQDESKIDTIIQTMDLSEDAKKKLPRKDLVKYFISLNEPTTYNLDSFLVGVFPPFKKIDFVRFEKTLNLWVKIHDKMYERFGLRNNNNSKIGLSHNWTVFEGPLGYILQKLLNERTLKKFERAGSNSDFFSLQHYCRFKLLPYLMHTFGPDLFEPFLRKYDFGDHPGFGDIYPHGIYKSLKRMHEIYPNKELWVTEFGFADNSDLSRPHFIFETVREITYAIRDGANIWGAGLWSDVDNYEWDQRMKVKLGLMAEKKIYSPLRPMDGKIGSWEAWRAIATLNKTKDLKEFEILRIKAHSQYMKKR